MLRKKPLTYHWLACYYIPGDTTKQWQRNIGIAWKPLLWFVKGDENRHDGPWRKDVVLYEDTFDTEHLFKGNGKDKEQHDWGQPVRDMIHIIEQYTHPGQLICDPFVGGGSTAVASVLRKRRFVGCDIDEQCVKTTQLRITHAINRIEEEE